MGHRLAPQAQADIDDIAYYVFGESGSLETADRLIESITTDANTQESLDTESFRSGKYFAT